MILINPDEVELTLLMSDELSVVLAVGVAVRVGVGVPLSTLSVVELLEVEIEFPVESTELVVDELSTDDEAESEEEVTDGSELVVVVETSDTEEVIISDWAIVDCPTT